MAGTAEGAYLIGGTHHHRSVAAGYHRNNLGNRAMYDFFLGTPLRAQRIGQAWGVNYVLFCPTDFAALDVPHAYPASLAAQLGTGHPPAWLERRPLRDTGLQLYRMR